VTEPKIPVENIYYLLCYSWNQLDAADKIKVSASDYTQYIDLFAKVLNNGCSYIFKRGIDREYRVEYDQLIRVRGKIDFNNNLRNFSTPSVKLHCTFDELSQDVLQNQIIKATLKRVLATRALDKSIRIELLEIYKRLLHISDISLNNNHFKKVSLHRNNLFYRFVLNVALLIHENISLDERSGTYEFLDFVRDDKKMARLFEHFVRNFYKESLRGSGYSVGSETIKWKVTETDPVAMQYLPIMKTDISLTSSSRNIIIDTKYYAECLNENYDKQKIISSNLYQLYAYVKNAEVKGGAAINSEGLLLYPTVTKELNITNTIDNHKITIKTINLNQDWKLIRDDLLNIVN
jgi:5-methylcytosine-specific restriction enzyme subunit McrC